MKPYFYQFEEELLSIEDRQSLLTVARNSFSNFILYTQYDNVNFLKFSDMLDFDKTVTSNVKKLIHSCSLKIQLMIIYHVPHKELGRHQDSPKNKRNTVLSIPLFPLDIYPHTLFWETFSSATPIAVAKFNKTNPCLLNTQKLHSIEKSDRDRFNFQLCFDEKFEHVLELIQDNKLFI
jgi:hypothetical protein